MTASERVEIAIVGGGLAGSALASRLAAAGREVMVLERAPRWQWRAGGVFASPAAVSALRDVGLDETRIRAVARLIPAMRVEARSGTTFRLTYGAEAGGSPAVGFDRSALDPALLGLARENGADIRLGATVETVDLGAGRVMFRTHGGDRRVLSADLIVGADGIRSLVARAAGVSRKVRLGPRIGLTYHLADAGSSLRDARMRLLPDGYVGVAPVPDGRVNIGIVLGGSWRRRLTGEGAESVTRGIVSGIPPSEDDDAAWRVGPPCDAVAGAWPLGHRVTRRAGTGHQNGRGWMRGWMLVGDAAGFLDPFTGEGLHRALVSAELAATEIGQAPAARAGALDGYERAMRRRFLGKDVVSWLVQLFLARPALFDYAARRVASRETVRSTMGLVMGDLVPASRALDPRYLAALLAP